MRASPVFSRPSGDDGRQRDVFPLPLLPVMGVVAEQGLSRSVRRRILRRDAVGKRANMAIASLNSLDQGKARASLSTCESLRSLPQVQRDAIAHILYSVKRCGPPPAHASHSGAIDALRVPCGSYQDVSTGVGDTVRVELEILSLPCLRDEGVDLVQDLGGEAGHALRDFENEMLRRGCQDEAIQRSSDGEASFLPLFSSAIV